MTKEQLAERNKKIARIKAEKQAEIESNRKTSGIEIEETGQAKDPTGEVDNIMPQDVSSGSGISDQGTTPAESTKPINNENPPKKKSSTAGKLLRRR
jgi:hypothetical protein